MRLDLINQPAAALGPRNSLSEHAAIAKRAGVLCTRFGPVAWCPASGLPLGPEVGRQVSETKPAGARQIRALLATGSTRLQS